MIFCSCQNHVQTRLFRSLSVSFSRCVCLSVFVSVSVTVSLGLFLSLSLSPSLPLFSRLLPRVAPNKCMCRGFACNFECVCEFVQYLYCLHTHTNRPTKSSDRQLDRQREQERERAREREREREREKERERKKEREGEREGERDLDDICGLAISLDGTLLGGSNNIAAAHFLIVHAHGWLADGRGWDWTCDNRLDGNFLLTQLGDRCSGSLVVDGRCSRYRFSCRGWHSDRLLLDARLPHLLLLLLLRQRLLLPAHVLLHVLVVLRHVPLLILLRRQARLHIGLILVVLLPSGLSLRLLHNAWVEKVAVVSRVCVRVSVKVCEFVYWPLFDLLQIFRELDS